VEIPIMNIRRLVSACRHNEVARDAQVSPTADTRPPEIVQDNVVKLCLMSSFLESGPNARYRLFGNLNRGTFSIRGGSWSAATFKSFRKKDSSRLTVINATPSTVLFFR